MDEGGFVEDLKKHRVEVLLSGAGIVVVLVLYIRSKGSSGAAAIPANANASGLMTGAAPTSVSTDMLASAMQAQQQSFQTALQQEQQSILQQVQQALQAAQQGNLGSQQGGATGGQGSGSSSGSSGYPGNTSSNPPVTQPPNTGSGLYPPYPAAFRPSASQVANVFAQYKLPQWVGALYVAHNAWPQSGAPTSQQISAFLNSVGLANGQGFVESPNPTGPNCWGVNCGYIPPQAAATIQNAQINWAP